MEVVYGSWVEIGSSGPRRVSESMYMTQLAVQLTCWPVGVITLMPETLASQRPVKLPAPPGGLGSVVSPPHAARAQATASVSARGDAPRAMVHARGCGPEDRLIGKLALIEGG
jgi:hypothetical protein